MQVVKDASTLAETTARERMAGRTVGFVSTMGYLHKGHLELLRFARERCDFLVASIFVNPLQFGPNDGFNKFPRDLQRDGELAEWAGVDLLYAPTADAMLPPGFRTFVEIEELSKGFCGDSRPDYYRGLCTVLLKLLHQVGPDLLFLGENDPLQGVLVRRMVADLGLAIKVIGFATVREADGLVMASHNVDLADEERLQANSLHASLCRAREVIAAGESSSERVAEAMVEVLREADALSVDDLAIVDADTLQPLARTRGRVLIALAARLGKVRLYDNMLVEA